MIHNQLFFQLDTEWSALHLPERPNGFGVLIIGDQNNFVEENSSLWTQNYARSQILNYLKEKGYTVFYSNLYGPNWGSSDSIKLAAQLYHVVMKREILNKRIHILAEGMGALIAMQLINRMSENIRSVALLNPCIDLLAHIENEKEHKFFYKKLIKEIAASYQLSEKEVEVNFAQYAPKVNLSSPTIPIKIWQSTNEKTYIPEIHSRKYQNGNKKVTLSYHVSESTFAFSQSVCNFFYEQEHEL
ncbi:alpha/beta hydrolase [Fredinandcohnia humi]